MAERLLALLDAWRIERADIAGIDMGGQPALVFAALHPERIGKLTVMAFPGVRRRGDLMGDPPLCRFGCNRFILRNSPPGLSPGPQDVSAPRRPCPSL